MKVDVIIPVYNPEPTYLIDALNSCMAQTYRNFNVIIADDGSDKINVKPLVAKYRNVLYVRIEDNCGPGAARNYGAKFGNGDLISFLDCDDIWMPQKLDLSVAEFLRDEEVAMTCGNYQRLVDRRKLCHQFYRRPPIINWETLMRINYVASGSTTVRRDIFEKVGGFNENFWIGEDADLWLRISEQYSIKYIHKILYHYSCIANGNSLTHRADILKYANKNAEISRIYSMERVLNGKSIVTDAQINKYKKWDANRKKTYQG